MDAAETGVVLGDVSYFEAVLRMLCAMLVGIVVGVERGRNHRPAGMRTHMLVALGACVTMVVSNFLFVQFRPLGATPDPARLGAQVVSGVGFLGAGTIIVTKRQETPDHGCKYLGGRLSGTCCGRGLLRHRPDRCGGGVRDADRL